MDMDFIKITVYFSLLVQIVTGVFDYYVIQLNMPSNLLIIKEILIMELIVQIVEGIFYIWLALNISSVTNITPHRYYDWYLTTPTMLISLCIYLVYLNNEERNIETTDSFFKIIYDNLNVLISILFLNFLMLTAGYLTEIKKVPQVLGVLLGFIPFFIFFYLIYHYFARFTLFGTEMFFYFLIVWSLYGVAALMSYRIKNIMYNILDLFAKNFFGLYLGYIILNSLN
jgi:bacteriorhodopsin